MGELAQVLNSLRAARGGRKVCCRSTFSIHVLNVRFCSYRQKPYLESPIQLNTPLESKEATGLPMYVPSL